MRDRLAKILQSIAYAGRTYDEFADNLLKSGVIVPPCKVGDVVWWTDGCINFVHSVEVTRIQYTKEYGFDMSGFTRNQTHKIFNEKDIGKIVFLTKEEAEKALKNQRKEREMA